MPIDFWVPVQRRRTGVPPAALPSSQPDPIVALLSTMVVGQWKKLTGPNQGSFNSAYPPLNGAGWRAQYDAGTTFASDASCQSTMVGNDSRPIFSVHAFSKMGLRDGASPRAVMVGSGHTDGYLSDILGLDIAGACASILAGGSGGNWVNEYLGCELLPIGSANPSWSNWKGNADSGSSFVPTVNANGQDRCVGAHGYAYLQWHPTAKLWSRSSLFAASPNANATMGSAEIFDDSGTNLTLQTDFVGNTTANGFVLNQAPMDVCDLDDKPYGWSALGGFSFYRFDNPLTAASFHSIITANNNPLNTGTHADAVIIPDPINGSTKRHMMIDAGGAQFDLMADITSATPQEFSGANRGTFVARPTFANAPTNFNLGWARNDVAGQIMAWAGTGVFYPITPNSSNPPRNWTWGTGVNTPSGDVPTTTVALNIPAGDLYVGCRAKYDPARNCYYAGAMGDVFLYKPGPNGAV